MNDNESTPAAASNPPISSSADNRPQDTMLMRGAFDAPATPGTLGRLDRFEILRLLGEGGMGQVYLAREPVTGVQVAIKIMKPQMAHDPQAAHRFLIEARHMYGMSHPHILRVMEVSDRKEGPYYVMPYIEGGSLMSLCKPGQALPEDRLLPIAQQIAGALAYAHTRGIIHRDLKPANVLLDKQGNAALSDFGLVRTVFNDSMVDPTASHLEGTAPYMSPAVARGDAEDTRCDIYAFGAVLYELLTGQPPYSGRTPQIILDQVLKGPPAPIRMVNPKANPALVRIAEGCMARELRDRYASMTDVVSDLGLAGKGKAPFGPHLQRRRLPGIVATAAGVIIAVGLIGLAVIGISKFPGNKPSAATSGSRNALPTGQDQFTWTATNGAITVTGYTGLDATVTIPDTIDGHPVTRIADQAFRSCASLTSMTIPASVAIIGKEAFAGCSKLIRVYFKGDAPGGGSYSSLFDGVKDVTICYQPGAKGWGKEFGGRPALLLADDYLYSVETNAITIAKYTGPGGAVTIPSKIHGLRVTSIGDNAFSDCAELTNVTIPNSVTNIGAMAFQSCLGLTEIAIPDGVAEIGDWAFNTCTGLTSVVFPRGLRSLGSFSFSSCAGLTNIVLPASVISMGSNPFIRCNRLTSITVDAKNPSCSSENGVLFDKEMTALLVFPSGRTGNYVVPEGVTQIKGNAFRECDKLTSITLPSSLAWIEFRALSRCPGLSGVYFNGNAPSLGADVFKSANEATVYYRPGTTGWGKEFGGRPTAVWEPKAQGK